LKQSENQGQDIDNTYRSEERQLFEENVGESTVKSVAGFGQMKAFPAADA